MSSQTSTLEKLSAQEAHAIGFEAYCFFYPLITMQITMKQITNLPLGTKPGFGPLNCISHIRQYPDADFKAVVRPNFDTLYSSAWLDLTQEPVILSSPDTSGRYFLLPMLDMWTDVFASPGWRTTGTKARDFAIVPPGWNGSLPERVERIDAPTVHVWLIGRTKTDGPADYEKVHALQDAIKVTPLSQWGKQATDRKHTSDPSIDMKTPPLETVNKMNARDYFALAAELLKVYKPHQTDWSMIARLERIGFVAGKSYDMNQLDSEAQAAIAQGTADALKLMLAKLKDTGRPVNGWAMNTETMGVYGNYYFKRAIVAMVGLGANQPDDAIYPLNFADADGKPLTGENKYVLRFGKDEMPPVDAFWSVTMYDADGFQVANPINRFAISSWMPLQKNADGSLEIYIQHENPGKDKEQNWLPAPASGLLGVTMRLYAPQFKALSGDWNPPAIVRCK